MRISKKQLEAIAQSIALESFEEEMLEVLPRCAPWHAERLGGRGLRRVVRLGIARARVHEVTNTGLLRTYVELMVKLGSFFDADPLLPWASQALRDPRASGEVARMDRLYEGAVTFLRAVAPLDGDEGPLRGFESALGDDAGAWRSSEDHVLRALYQLHPTLCAYAGDEALLRVVRRAPSEAARLGIDAPAGAAVVAGLAVVLGGGFAEDPLYPWIQATLEDTSAITAPERLRRLREAIRSNAADDGRKPN